jgi:hypothetical protein
MVRLAGRLVGPSPSAVSTALLSCSVFFLLFVFFFQTSFSQTTIRMFNKLQKTTIWVSQAEWQTKEDYCYTILALFFLIDKAELPNSKLQGTAGALIRPCY